MIDGDVPVSPMTWHGPDEIPPKSYAPFHLFYVWLKSPKGLAKGGIPRVVQYSRNNGWPSFGELELVAWTECPRPPEAGPEMPWREVPHDAR